MKPRRHSSLTSTYLYVVFKGIISFIKYRYRVPYMGDHYYSQATKIKFKKFFLSEIKFFTLLCCANVYEYLCEIESIFKTDFSCLSEAF